MTELDRTAIVVLDVQRAFDDADYWGPRNNSDCDHDLAAWLRERGLGGIAICGITTNHCCETTARVGGNVGFDVVFVLDATHAFDRAGPDGTVMTADELARATATSLHGEVATVVSTAELTLTAP